MRPFGRLFRTPVSALLAAALFSLQCAKAPTTTAKPCSGIIGEYEAVSESEWALELSLGPDGSAIILLTVWDDHSNEREDHRYSGRWHAQGGEVVIEYDGLRERLRFVEDLSFEECGEKGSSPGLYGVSSDSTRSRFAGVSLWCTSALQTHRSSSGS